MKARLIKRFEDEIAVLERELTQQLPKEIQRAREHGDLRENAEYHAAKERQRFVEARVSMLPPAGLGAAAHEPGQGPARQGGVRVQADRA